MLEMMSIFFCELFLAVSFFSRFHLITGSPSIPVWGYTKC